MSQLIKRGRFYHVFYFKQGKYSSISTHTTDLRAARNFQIRFDNDLLNVRVKGLKNKASWAQFCRDYVAYSETNKKPRSQTRDKLTIKLFNGICGIRYFDEFNFNILEYYKTKRKQAGVLESSINRELSTLKHMGAWAVVAKYCISNPVAQVKWLPVSHTQKDRFLSLDEIEIVMNKPKSLEVRAIVRLQLWAALRLGEAVHLAWSDVDFEKNLIYITSKEGWSPKTRQKQVIPLNARLKEYLLGLDRSADFICGSSPMREETASAVISKMLKSYGIRGATSHTLRHTAISWAAMSGMDFPSLVRFARHCEPRQTMRYTHLMPSYSQNLVDKLPY